jgi:hypothetical protein
VRALPVAGHALQAQHAAQPVSVVDLLQSVLVSDPLRVGVDIPGVDFHATAGDRPLCDPAEPIILAGIDLSTGPGERKKAAGEHVSVEPGLVRRWMSELRRRDEARVEVWQRLRRRLHGLADEHRCLQRAPIHEKPSHHDPVRGRPDNHVPPGIPLVARHHRIGAGAENDRSWSTETSRIEEGRLLERIPRRWARGRP